MRNSDNSVVVPPNGFLALTGFEKLAGEQPEEADCHYVEQKTTAVPIDFPIHPPVSFQEPICFSIVV